jgi:hypothetical protein
LEKRKIGGWVNALEKRKLVGWVNALEKRKISYFCRE